nr:hypothetical protein [Tanacetum cinerariifolium]
MINDDIKISKAYKTYLEYATGKVPPKKARKFKQPASPILKIEPASPKEPTQKDKRASGSSDGVDFESEVLDEPTGKTKDINEGTGVKLGVLDVSKDDSFDSNNDSWGDSEDESDDDHDKDDNDDTDDNDNDSGNDDDGHNDAQDTEQTDSDDKENPSFTLKDYEEEQDEEYVFSPEKDKSDDEENMFEEEDNDVAKELYGDLNIT